MMNSEGPRSRVVARIHVADGLDRQDLAIIERDDGSLVLGAMVTSGEYLPLTQSATRLEIVQLATDIAARNPYARTAGPALDQLAVGLLAILADMGALARDVDDATDRALQDIETEGEG